MWILLLAILAAAIHLFGYVVYARQSRGGGSQPNIITWGVWTFLVLLNAFSFFNIGDDPVRSLLPFASSLGVLWTFPLLLVQREFTIKKPSVKELSILLICVVAGILWKLKIVDAAWANVAFQIGIIVSFIPTIEGVWGNPNNEKPFAWWLWVSAHTLQLGVITARFTRVEEFAAPIVGIILHGIVAMLCYRKICPKE